MFLVKKRVGLYNFLFFQRSCRSSSVVLTRDRSVVKPPETPFSLDMNQAVTRIPQYLLTRKSCDHPSLTFFQRLRTMAPKKYIPAESAANMKPHYMCGINECRAELRAAGQPVHQDLSLAEVRIAVRELRLRQGQLTMRSPGNDVMQQIKNGKKAELVEMSHNYQLPMNPKATVGELRLALRQAVMSNCSRDTTIEFGKHKGASFMEVYTIDRPYSLWAMREVETSESPDWKLMQFAPVGEEDGTDRRTPGRACISPSHDRHLHASSDTTEGIIIGCPPGICSSATFGDAGDQRDDATDDVQNAHYGGRVEGGKRGCFLRFQDPQDQHELRIREDRSFPGMEPTSPTRGSVEVEPTLIYQEPKCLVRDLPSSDVEKLDQISWEVTKALDYGRVFLMEVACAPESLLTNEAHAKGLTAMRASLFNGCDLTTPEGLRKTLALVKKHRPVHIWLSTECGSVQSYSEFQPKNRTTAKGSPSQTKGSQKTTHRRYGGCLLR